MSEARTCTKCGETKSIDGFYRQSSCAGGRRPYCKECDKARIAARNKAAPEIKKASDEAYRASHREELRLADRERYDPERAAEYRTANREKRNQQRREWGERNPDKLRVYKAKRLATPSGKLAEYTGNAVRRSLRNGGKDGQATFDILGYSADDLKSHLESLFQPGMSWENYSYDTWHIDHIRPLTSFSIESPVDPDFREAWALSNLQPLWAVDNLKKGSKWIPEKLAA